jgi:hypothetical protein
MQHTLAAKLDLLAKTLAAIAARFDPAPFAARIEAQSG